MKKTVQCVAVKAIIVNSRGEVLLLQKSNDDSRHAGNSRRYNLPGGKIMPAEQIEAALRREVFEETGLSLGGVDLRPIFAGEWRPIVNGVPFQIVGMFFVCRGWTGKLALDSEHDDYVWVSRSSVATYDILPPEDEAIGEYFARKHSSESTALQLPS